jgi:hypothetical protein
MFQTGLSKHAYMEIQTVLVREGAMAIMGKHFEHERIVLGEERYQGCTFINCELVYDGQPVQLLDNTFADCHWSFEGAAGSTLDFLIALCRDQPEIQAALARELGVSDDRIEPDRAKAH